MHVKRSIQHNKRGVLRGVKLQKKRVARSSKRTPQSTEDWVLVVCNIDIELGGGCAGRRL